MKVILGPLPCRSCGSPVTIVRRDVEQPCDSCCPHRIREGYAHRCFTDADKPHTHTLPDVGPFTPVDDDGTRHECSNG